MQRDPQIIYAHQLTQGTGRPRPGPGLDLTSFDSSTSTSILYTCSLHSRDTNTHPSNWERESLQLKLKLNGSCGVADRYHLISKT
eukprot:scaffold3025_cov132-Isochrysis_galbana.AAC.5